MKTVAFALAVVALCGGFAAADEGEYPTLAFLETIPELSNFTAAVEFSELYHLLDETEGPYTIFAPNNEGFVTSLTPFEASVEDFITGDEENEEHTAAHLKYMIVKGTYLSSNLTDGLVLHSITDNGAGFTIEGGNGTWFAVGNNTYYPEGNRGEIVEADLVVPGSKNIVHIINQFLFTEDE